MNVGVLGLGSIGLRHSRNLLALGVGVVGFDPDPERCTRFTDIGGRAMETRERVLEQSEAMIIATPNAQHYDDLKISIDSGCHVLAEKPLAHHINGLEPLLKEAEAKGLVVLAGFNLRFHPCVIAAKERIDSGAIGQPIWVDLISASYLPDWRPNSDYRKGYAADPATGGVVFDAIHEIDLALHLLGPARVVTASAVCTGILGIPSDDIADFTLVHINGTRSNFHLDYISRPPVRTTRIVGTNGTLVLDLRARRFEHLNVDGTTIDDVAYPGSFAEDYVTEMTAFLDRVGGRKEPVAVDEQGLGSLKAAIAVRRLAGLPQP